MRASSALAVLCCFAGACDEPASDVVGRVFYRYVNSGAEVPIDISAWQFQAFVPSGSGFIEYPAVHGTSSGTFVIPGVVEGALLLRTIDQDGRTAWRESETHDIEIVTNVIGRPDAASATGPTPLRLVLGGLDPWQPGDFLFANCWENGTESSGLHSVLTPRPATGDTSIDAELDWNYRYGTYSFGPSGRPYLMNPAAGDTLTISRLRDEEAGNITWSRLTQVATGPAPTQVDGETSTFSAMFASVPPSTNLQLAVDLPSIRARLSGEASASWWVSIMAVPAVLDGVQIGPSLLYMGSDSFDRPIDDIVSFGDPFDPSWPRIVESGFRQTRTAQVPGSMAPVEVGEGIHVTETLGLAEQRLEPSLGLLGEATLNGVRIEEGIVVPWNGTEPLSLHVALPPSAIGFDAQLITLTPSTAFPIARLITTDAHIRFPRDGFAIGQTLVLRVRVTIDRPGRHETSVTYFGPFVLGAP